MLPTAGTAGIFHVLLRRRRGSRRHNASARHARLHSEHQADFTLPGLRALQLEPGRATTPSSSHMLCDVPHAQ